MRRLAILIVLSALPLKSELLPIRAYTTADGLASDRTNRIVVDSRGFLWFGSPEGLSRFDGYRFVTYGVEEGLPHAAVTALIETRSGDRWIGTPRGLSRIVTSGGNPRVFHPWSAAEIFLDVYHGGDAPPPPWGPCQEDRRPRQGK